MKILHIGKFFPPHPGGIESFLADLIAAQETLGDDVYALVHANKPSLQPWPSIKPNPIFTKRNIYTTPCYGRLLYAPVSPHFPFWLSRVIRDIQPDVLHFHMPNTSSFWALFSSISRSLPWVLHWHSDVVPSTFDKRLIPAYSIYRHFEQAMLKQSQAIIATSPIYLSSSIPLKNWQEKSYAVPLGIDETRIPQASQKQLTEIESWWGTSSLRVLNIGRLTYYKGQAALIEAASKIDGVKVIIVGKGELQSRLEKLILELGVQDKVYLAGFCTPEQISALFHTSDCFCLPSIERTEAFGVVIMEAMAHAKAVVASSIPGSGVNWVIEEGKTGLLTPINDSSALASALQKLRDKPDFRESLGNAGYTRFIENFKIERVAESLFELYRKIGIRRD